MKERGTGGPFGPGSWSRTPQIFLFNVKKYAYIYIVSKDVGIPFN
jgi:hypothetical protein